MTATHHRAGSVVAVRVPGPSRRGLWLRGVAVAGFAAITVAAVIEVIAALLGTASLATLVRATSTVDLTDITVPIASLLVSAAGIALIVWSLVRGNGCDQGNGP
ncbi:hypothetical protein J4H86_10775 [Spiractinospora alimapuensis]|uniref:hypothetical protein n=1 Tax=Spiractinospora alimapuensis TaxID=2820884 RepID=UPI001F40B559|nr:hypothetical protein [Spiractinospora alimapuensis]QVQ54128.1 hypothetical protein J4H86_10775 [Spiractinospora alimapuensis]